MERDCGSSNPYGPLSHMTLTLEYHEAVLFRLSPAASKVRAMSSSHGSSLAQDLARCRMAPSPHNMQKKNR